MPFDEYKAQRAIDFISQLKHTKGVWAGKPWHWLPWQIELVRKLFGTVRDDGYRQYRFCYVEIPKKNGKSELAAAIALYMLYADGEQGPEVYLAAGDQGQAGICFGLCDQMVKNHPVLNSKSKILQSVKRIVYYDRNGILKALSSEAFTKHGLNPSCVVIDELHAHPTRDLYDVLTEGTDAARKQQLVFIITTAGIHDQEAIGWQVHEQARQISEGIIEQPNFYPIIYTTNENDNWEDSEVWKPCNPSLGHIFDLKNIQDHYDAIAGDTAKQNNFRRFRLNQWVSQITRYIPMDHWDACNAPVNAENLKGRPCYGGLDLAASVDTTAFVLVFPPTNGGKWEILPWFFIPEDTVRERSKTDRADYSAWVQEGYMNVTPGNRIDQEFIRKTILLANQKYDLREVAYDPHANDWLAPKLENEDGVIMVEHRQGWKSMSPPTKELLRKVMGHELAHGGHKVLRWHADNLAVKIDSNENVSPQKDKSTGRIDGMVALIMALGRASLHMGNMPMDYNKRAEKLTEYERELKIITRRIEKEQREATVEEEIRIEELEENIDLLEKSFI